MPVNMSIEQDKHLALPAQQQDHDQTDMQYQARGCCHCMVMKATG